MHCRGDCAQTSQSPGRDNTASKSEHTSCRTISTHSPNVRSIARGGTTDDVRPRQRHATKSCRRSETPNTIKAEQAHGQSTTMGQQHLSTTAWATMHCGAEAARRPPARRSLTAARATPCYDTHVGLAPTRARRACAPKPTPYRAVSVEGRIHYCGRHDNAERVVPTLIQLLSQEAMRRSCSCGDSVGSGGQGSHGTPDCCLCWGWHRPTLPP